MFISAKANPLPPQRQINDQLMQLAAKGANHSKRLKRHSGSEVPALGVPCHAGVGKMERGEIFVVVSRFASMDSGGHYPYGSFRVFGHGGTDKADSREVESGQSAF
jgi:hypothetical protein